MTCERAFQLADPFGSAPTGLFFEGEIRAGGSYSQGLPGVPVKRGQAAAQINI